jgi:transcriptional regulator with GAF, ATPase, and Fis domain
MGNERPDGRSAFEPLTSSAGAGPGPVVIIGQSDSMKSLYSTVRAVASTRATILIEGESGTGKELIVRALHEMSPRADRPFVAVNCAALPEGLVESTLFGHERGAFTGANARYIGAFERADGGTLLMDEISELRLDLQAKLLRAIQERQFERVGGGRPVQVDVRIVATTNRDLAREVEAGRFRADLFYRLRVVPIRVPALRERPEDIPALVKFFAARAAAELGVSDPLVPADVLWTLAQKPWPGNVRQLEHAVERAVILSTNGALAIEDVLLDESVDVSNPTDSVVSAPRAVAAGGNEEEPINLRALERRAIERALHATGGHRLRAARLLGISDRTLRSKLNDCRRPAEGRPNPSASAADPSGGAGSPAGSDRPRWENAFDDAIESPYPLAA